MDTRLRFFMVALSCGCGAAWADDADHSTIKPQEVVVTATPLRESSLETTQPTTIVGGADLVRLRALSLGETLASQPGINATYFGPQASRPVIRGLSGERVQMYEDGGEALDVSALSSDHSVTIDPLIAERMEVVRGPATLLYGSGASGGLVNVITNRIPERMVQTPLSGAFELRGDSGIGERSGVALLDAGSGPWAFHIDGHKRETDDVRIPGFALSRALRDRLQAEGADIDETRDRLTNSDGESDGGAVGGSYIGSRGFAGVGVSKFNTNYGIPDTGGEEGVRIDMNQTKYDFKGELRDIGSFITVARFRGTYNDYEHAEVEGGGDIGTLFQQKGMDGRLAFDHAPIAGWRGNFGIQLRDIDLDVTGEEALVPPSKSRNTGYFLFEERAFGPVTVDVGTRLEQQRIEVGGESDLPDYDRNAVSLSSGVLWKATPEYSVALNLTSTQRHPSATELYANGPHIASQRFELGDSTLGRERAQTVDLGLRKTEGAWRGSISAFRSDYTRYTYAALTGEFEGEADELLPIVQYTQADAEFSGFEAEIHLPVIEAGAGAFSTRLLADYVRAKLKDGGDLPQIPPMRLGGELTYELEQFASSVSVMRYDGQDRVSEDELPTDGYTMVNVDMSYRMPFGRKSMLMFLKGANLLDEEARRHTSPLKDVAPLPGRSVAAGVRFEF